VGHSGERTPELRTRAGGERRGFAARDVRSGSWPTASGARSRRQATGDLGASKFRRALGIAAYAAACLTSVAVLTVSGVGYFVYNDLESLGSSGAIGNGPKSKGDDVNILLIGLDSRKDGDGNDLPNSILSKLHAGSKRGVDNGTGGYNTNTLILMHVPGDGSKATAFSIPRTTTSAMWTLSARSSTGKSKRPTG
jgi:Transcriptional regulator